MATYTGKLLDFGLAPLAAFSPRAVIIPSEAAFSGGNVLATRRIEVPIAADGTFTVDLEPSVNTTPNVTYTLRIEWLDSSATYVGMDILSGIVAALGGGSLPEMGGIPISRFWVGPDPGPPNPEPDTWWLDTTTGNLNEWI